MRDSHVGPCPPSPDASSPWAWPYTRLAHRRHRYLVTLESQLQKRHPKQAQTVVTDKRPKKVQKRDLSPKKGPRVTKMVARDTRGCVAASRVQYSLGLGAAHQCDTYSGRPRTWRSAPPKRHDICILCRARARLIRFSVDSWACAHMPASTGRIDTRGSVRCSCRSR